MLALKVYRMLKRVEELDEILKEASWEYNTACNYGCTDMITQDFFDSMNAAQDELNDVLDPIYSDAKMRRVAEILDEDIAELFRDWDICEELPFE